MPNRTSYVVAPEADHVSVGFALAPVAPFAGDGDDGVPGAAGGVVVPAVTVTLSNVDVLSVLTSWLVTARPMLADAGIDVVVLPSVVHVVPLAETEAVTVLPLRASLSQAGIGCVP